MNWVIAYCPETRRPDRPPAGLLAIACAWMTATILAQVVPSEPRPQRSVAYEAVAIRPNVDGTTFGSMGILPDGTFRLVNSPLSNLRDLHDTPS